jgi:hypothetical protein
MPCWLPRPRSDWRSLPSRFVASDADALHARWEEAGTAGLGELRNTDYKMREFAVVDPDNNLMLYGSMLSGQALFV